MRLALDALGGDHAPAAAVEGAVSFAKAHPKDHVVLVGPHAVLEELLGKAAAKLPNLSLHHASDAVLMDDAAGAVRSKKDSSLRVAFELAKAGSVDAVVSAGNSGAVMAGALLVLGRLPQVARPAFAALFPALKGAGRCLLIDAGANTECKPSWLVQFALMGEAYLKLSGVERPRVAVLSNGEEEGKGTDLTRETFALLKDHAEELKMAFIGYVEGKDLFSGEVDVIVTDGFTGNVVLKTSEGTAAAVAGLLRNAIEKSPLPERVGALLLHPTFAGLKKVVDYAEYGGAPLLGVDGVVIVAHGRSNARAIHRALEVAKENADAGLRAAVASRLLAASSWLSVKQPRG